MVSKYEFLTQLDEEQREAAVQEVNTILTACPGSGKTRTLTYRLAYLANKYEKSKKYNIAITYTNRAAAEVEKRIDDLGIEVNNIWVGTIHQFCMEFIIRPYAMYAERLRKGYTIIDEFVTDKYFGELCEQEEIEYNSWEDYKKNDRVYKLYIERLIELKEIDFDDILEESYQLLHKNEFIQRNISGIIRTINVDEYQDTNERAYQILALLYKSNKSIVYYFVGDVNQAIYGGLGGCAKSNEELDQLFDASFNVLELKGCYRSTQQIVDYYKEYQVISMNIHSEAKIKDEMGTIYFNDQVTVNEMYDLCEEIIIKNLEKGIQESEICVLAPQWWQVYNLGEKLKEKMPSIMFDAPEISPVKFDPMNVFCLIAKLLFTDSGCNVRYRKKLASTIIDLLEKDFGIALPVKIDVYDILYSVNITCNAGNGTDYLRNAIEGVLKILYIKIEDYPKLNELYRNFFEKTEDRIRRYSLDYSIEGYKRVYKEKKGIVLSTYHGVKGEEYKTVIACGMLNGYVPSWHVILDKNMNESEEADRLIYVVTSRAKKNIYVISEQGRHTKSRDPLVPTKQFIAKKYGYMTEI